MKRRSIGVEPHHNGGYQLRVDGRLRPQVYGCRMSAHWAMNAILRADGYLDAINDNDQPDLAAEAVLELHE